MSRNYFYAVATLVGTIVGAGLFSVPLVTSQAGIFVFTIALVALVFVQYYIHKMYAEIVLSTKTIHRVPGYVEIYVGKKYKKLASFIAITAGYGSLLAYLILGGVFLHSLLGNYLGGDAFFFSAAMFFVGSLIVLFGIRTIASFELIMTAFLLLVVAVITIRSFGFIRLENFIFADWKYSFLMYGPVFFAIGGNVAIPEVCRLLKNEKKNIRSAIFWGTMIPALLTAVFVTVVVGVNDGFTTADTLSGLSGVLSDGVITLALVFGFLSVATSFLTTSQAIREIYWWDFKMNKILAWGLAVFVPFILLMAGVENFTKVVAFTGAVSGGLVGVVLVYISFKVQHKAQQKSIVKTNMSKTIAIILSLLFILGLIYTLVGLF